MKNRYYLAYGSNLNFKQMNSRCHDAKYIGKAIIKDYALLFKGRGHLTIEPRVGSEVPVGVWLLSQDDEMVLDRQEGFPDYYHKENFTLEVNKIDGETQTLDCFAYVMQADEPITPPSSEYVAICTEGYQDFGFDTNYLKAAQKESENEKLPQK